MADAKTEWKVIHVSGHELESKLNELSEADNDIFSVQYTDQGWAIIIRKVKKDESNRKLGFSK
jgi:hypothetical protein